MEFRTAKLPGLLQRCMYMAQGSYHGYFNRAMLVRYPTYGHCTLSCSIGAVHSNAASCYNWSGRGVREFSPLNNTASLTRAAWSSSQISTRGVGTSTSLYDMQGGRKESNESGHKDVFPPDRGMNMLVAVENDYLSWMRNTYISTLASLTMLNFDPVAGSAITATGMNVLVDSYGFMTLCNMFVNFTVGLTIAGMNVLVGSLGYMNNLSNLKQRGYVRWYRCRIYQTIALVHLVLWYCILVLLIPDWHMVEEDISRVEDGAKEHVEDGAKEPTK